MDASVYLFLLIICIIFEMDAYYRTHKNFVINSIDEEDIQIYQVWSPTDKKWESV